MRVAIFDWDGTLFDSVPAIVSCFRTSCSRLGVSEPPEELIRSTIGMSLPDVWPLLIPDREGDHAEAGRIYREEYVAVAESIRLFGGVHEGLRRLADSPLALAVATGKSRAGLTRAFRTTTSARYFRVSRCAEESRPKPAPDMIHEILEELGLGTEQAVMIGDTVLDMKMAAAAEIEWLAVGYGAERSELLRDAQRRLFPGNPAPAPDFATLTDRLLSMATPASE